jgi:ubiquinone biosynthesis protein UbiJ
VRGPLTVVPEDWQLTHVHESRRAVQLSITFSEHNFTVGETADTKDSSVKSALTKALEAIQSIENAILQVTGAISFGQQFVSKVTGLLSNFKANYAKFLGNSNARFNGGSASDIPALLPVNQGGSLNTDTGEFETDKFQTAALALNATATVALEIEQLKKDVNALRSQLADILAELKGASNGRGALEFHQNILELREAGIRAQEVLEKGIQASQPRLINYVVPRLMSIREVAFLNGLPLEDIDTIDKLNPEIGSVNFLPKGTKLRVPVP